MEVQPESLTLAQEANETYRLIAWRLIPFLILCYLVAFIDRSNIAIAKLQFIKDLGLSEAAYGLGGGLFYLGYSLFEVPSNLLLARTGARLTIARILVLWSLFSAALAFMHTALEFYGLRFLIGAAEAGFFPGVLFYLCKWTPAARRARFTALFMSAMTLSGLIGNPISGWIMRSMDGVGGFKGWQWMFIIEGLPGVLLGIVALFYLADRPEQARWLTDRQKSIVTADVAAEQNGTGAAAHSSLGRALSDSRFYLLAFMSMALFASIGGIGLWLPTIVHKAGITDLFEIGLISAVPYIFGLAAQQVVARRSDRRVERLWHTVIPGSLGAIGWLLLPFAQNPLLLLALICLAAAGTFGASGPFWTMPSAALRGSAAAAGIAIITTCGSIAAFIVPIIVGKATELTGSLHFGQFFFGALLGAASLLLLAKSRKLARK